MEWNAAAIIGLERLIAEGKSYSQIARLFGVSRCAVAGAVRRHIRGLSTRGEREIRNQPTHYGMIEPWRVYTARKQKERAEARAAAPVTSTGPRQEAD